MMSFNSFPDPNLMAQLSAKMLIEIGAINFRPNDPFQLTSGKISPVYIDCRKIISFPRVRSTLMDFGASTILRNIGFESIDGIAGGETAGIPFAAWLAERLSLPMQYVRKKPKGFGRDAQIEGDLKEGSRVLLVEDLTTDGGSKIKFCQALRDAGATVSDTFVIFFYDIFPDTRKNLGEIGINLHHLTTWWDVLEVCKNENLMETKAIAEIESFLHSPVEWSTAHGGIES
jgi:orotate phosphoribosyltransferase